jgi:2'-5' RNA ligase
MSSTSTAPVRKRRALPASDRALVSKDAGGAVTSADLQPEQPDHLPIGTKLVEKPDFDACVAAQVTAGKSEEDAKRICGTVMRDAEKATWPAAYVDDLPDSAFVYVEEGGEKDDQGKTVPRSLRHFPVRDASGTLDLAHLRNASARLPQSDLPALVREKVDAEIARLIEEASQRNGPVEKAYTGTGVMIACAVAEEISKAFQVEGAVAEDVLDHHVTIAYLGKRDDLGPEAIGRAREVLAEVVRRRPPIPAATGGVARFAASSTSDAKDVAVVLVDSVELCGFRGELVAALKAAGLTPSEVHGFTPHITLAYVDPGEPLELPSVERRDFVIDGIFLAVAGEREVHQLAPEHPQALSDVAGAADVSPIDAVPLAAEPSNKSNAIPAVARALGGFSFEVGASGTGIVQTHERCLTPAQVELLDALGWDSPVELEPSQVELLVAWCGDGVVAALEQAKLGNPEALASLLWPLLEPRRWVQLDEAGRALVARAYPVEIHTDLRLQQQGDDYFEGGEVLTPGNQFRQNLLVAGNDIPLDMTPEPDRAVFRGPAAWMSVGASTPQSFPPGAPGSTEFGWSRFRVRARFNWRVLERTDDVVKFEFDGDGMTGTWVATRGEPTWTLSCMERTVEKATWMPIVKADDRRLVTGILLQPETVDAQGDIYSEEVIANAAHEYLAAYNAGTVVGLMHKDMNRPLQLVESWLAPVPLVIEGRLIKKGTWIATVRVLDDAIWQDVKRGKITGFSIGGVAKVRPIDPRP